MNHKTDIGKKGEDLASEFLIAKGYSVLERNWRYKRSEIDLITKKDELIVFVEVKTKTYVAYGNPEDAVDKRKAAKVVEGAEEYIHQIDWTGDIRFDIISIVLEKDEQRILHLEDAFY